MATGIQSGASSIGMAPTSSAGPAGPLPTLAGDQAAAGGTSGGATPNAGATDPNAAAAPAAPAGFDINAIASKGRWIGPLLAIGGGIAAIAAFSKGQNGSGFLKWGGTSAALSGLMLTGVGFKAKGIETGTKATEEVAMTQMNSIVTMATTEIDSLKQQLAEARQAGSQLAPGAGAGAGSGAGTGATPGAEEPIGAGLGTTIVPGAGVGAGTGAGTGIGSGAGTGTGAGTGVGATPGTGNVGAWSIQSLIGASVQLAGGNTANGGVIADPGNYKIDAAAGDPGGYATVEEANAAARSSMSTELPGSRFLRWMVVEHEGRFYGTVAKQLADGEQATPITPQMGEVVAWSAMNHVTVGGQSGWQAYTWSKASGAQAIAVPYGTTAVFPGGAVGSQPGTSGGGLTSASASDPGTAPIGTTAATSGVRFDPASEVGRTFAVNASSTAEGDLARGGMLQVQKFVEASAGGFGTAEEAAAAARAARTAAGGGDQWARWVSLQGADGRYYVYQGSIVKRETAPLQAAAPMHVFGAGFAEYYDGASAAWKAVRDSAAA